MYRDVIEKIAFHKERIINGFIDIGVYPTSGQIDDLLSSVDTSLAYLKVREVKEGDKFDTEAYNNMFNSIYRDLELLYRILYEYGIKEYTKLTSFIDTHLDQLQQTVEFFQEKSSQEISTTSLGNTVLFQNNAFNIKRNNASIQVGLGNVKLHPGSRVSSIFDANDVEGDQIFFEYKRENEVIRTSPFNYNSSFFIVPGDLKKTEYDYNIADTVTMAGATKINIGKKPLQENKYVILGAKNKVMVKQFGERTGAFIKNRPTGADMLSLHDKSYIDFYTIGAKSISFRFNRKPISTNFSLDNESLTNLDYVQHFFIEMEANSMISFDIEGGQVYALKDSGVVNDEQLFFLKRTEGEKDFHIIEYELGTPNTYEVSAHIINHDSNLLDINNVMIKELLATERKLG